MSTWSKSIAIFTISLLLALALCGQLSCGQEEPAKRVLVLNSYSKGFLWTDDIVKGIESVLGPEKNDVELTIEYMDTKSIKYDARYKEKLYDLYKYKYGNQTFDLVIATDDNAFNFLCEYHEDIFPGTPVVFCGVNNLEAPNLVDRDIFTGVIELLSEKETIDIALSLHPEVREIVFVIDSTPTGTQVRSQIQGLSGYYENIRMTCIGGSLSMEQVEDNVSRLSDDTIVFFGPFNRDKSGKYYSSEEAASRVCRASVRPVYGYSVQVLPYGITGGKLIGGVHHGQVAATMAKRILVGETVRDIPVLTEPQTQTMFDYNQMQRWGIKESDLPEDSIIVNKPYSFYEENKELILSIIAFMIVQTTIIVALVVNRSRRKAAEERTVHLNLVLRAIRNVSQLVTKEHDRNRLLQGACDNLIEIRGYRNAWIALIDESGTLVTTAEAGLGEAFVPMVKRLKHGELIECAQKALLQSGVVVIDDPISTCRDCPLAERCEGRRAMTIRLEHEERVFGLFSVALPAKLAADREEQALFKEVAGDIAFALYNLEQEEKRKRAEDALAESEKKLSQIINGSSTPLFVIDKTHTVTHWNKACENLTGVSAKEMVGIRRPWSPFYSTERPVLADIIVDGSTDEELARYYGGKFRKSALIDGAYEVEDFFPMFGNKWLFLTAAPLRDDQGGVTGAVESLRDITERKNAEEALRESEEKYRVLFETAKDAIFLSDETGKFVGVNSAACLSLGYSKEELLKMSNKEVDVEPIGYETFTKVRDGLMEETVFEVNHKRKDGTLVPVEISGKIIKSDGSKIFLAIARDITERKRADEKLKRTMADLKRSNTDLEQFAYVVSHDLQEPLRMVSSYVQLLSRRYVGKLDSDADDFIGFAVDGTSRMQTLIQDLLTYSRVGTRGKPLTPTNCEDLLGQVLANLKLTIEDNSAVVTHDALPTINVDASQLNQLLQNLLENAIKFHGDDAPRVHVTAERKAGEWLFSVTDNGIGVKPEYFERIFVLFQRLHGRDEYSGTGIGLAVCKKIVERHGGRMWVESEPGHGATFYFTIPEKGGVQI